jgi:hypothetical protein
VMMGTPSAMMDAAQVVKLSLDLCVLVDHIQVQTGAIG